MLYMNINDLESYVQQKKDESLCLVEFVCQNIDDKYMIEVNDNHSDNNITLVDSKNKIKKFNNIDSAFSEIKHITKTMTVHIY